MLWRQTIGFDHVITSKNTLHYTFHTCGDFIVFTRQSHNLNTTDCWFLSTECTLAACPDTAHDVTLSWCFFVVQVLARAIASQVVTWPALPQQIQVSTSDVTGVSPYTCSILLMCSGLMSWWTCVLQFAYSVWKVKIFDLVFRLQRST